MAAVMGSCASILSLLQEDNDQLKIAALKKLNEPGVVEMFWTEISDFLVNIEVLHEDEEFPERQLAALVAAKVYYHLDESNDALRLALRAGPLFNVADSSSPFVRAVISYCIDKYINNSIKAVTKKDKTEEAPAERAAADGMEVDGASTVDSSDEDSEEDKAAITALIEDLHKNCLLHNELTYAMGVAFESLDIAKVEAILDATAKDRQSEMLAFCLEQAPMVISNKDFRTQVLQVVSKKFQEFAMFNREADAKACAASATSEEDAALLSYCQSMAATFLRLGDATATATLLIRLTHSKEVKLHMAAIQIAFDLLLADQAPFLSALTTILAPAKVPPPASPEALAAAAGTTTEGAVVEANAVAEDSETAPLIPPANVLPEEDLEESPESARLTKVVEIIQGAHWSRIALQLMSKSNKTDLGILDRLRNKEVGSISHNALVIAHAFAQAGTSNDAFLRVNIDWLGKAQCWNKFTATASMGVVHAGHANGRRMLARYLPPAGATADSNTAGATTRSAYSEAGAFYALGLIHSKAPNTPEAVSVREYLYQQLKDNSTSEIRLHGACLGLGLLSVGLADKTIYEALKTVLYTDMAVAGEAAAIAIGLLMQGTLDQPTIDDLHAYAHESPHEKIVRACALALGLVAFKKEEEAETLLNTLAADGDATIRYGGVLACGLAYAGTSSLSAQRRLLKTSVSDVSEDVRRGAVLSLGFVLADRPHKVPESLKLICENYSFQVRYGAALALGIGCAGTFNKEAVDLLLQLRSDQHDIVRQAAGIALGLVLMNATDAHGPKVAQVREELLKASADGNRKEAVIAKMGATIGIGLMNAGGRNATTGFVVTAPGTSSGVPSSDAAYEGEVTTGQVRFHAVSGLFLLSQLWYWFPLSIAGSLAIRPSLLVGVTEDLKVPANFNVRCVAQKEKLAYPEPLKKVEKEKLEKTTKAVLSVSKPTAEAAGDDKKDAVATAGDKKEVGEDKMDETKKGEDAEMAESPAAAIAANPAASPVLTAQGPTRKYEVLPNGSRILPAVSDSIVFIHGSSTRFVPLFAPNPATSLSLASTSAPIRKTGPIVLVDQKPEAGEFESLEAVPPAIEPAPASSAANNSAAATAGASTAGGAPAADETRVPIPEDFEWDGN